MWRFVTVLTVCMILAWVPPADAAPGTPGVPVVTARYADHMTLTFTAAANAAYYEVYVQRADVPQLDKWFNDFLYVPPRGNVTSTTTQIRGLNWSSRYRYRVRAVDSSGVTGSYTAYSLTYRSLAVSITLDYIKLIEGGTKYQISYKKNAVRCGYIRKFASTLEQPQHANGFLCKGQVGETTVVVVPKWMMPDLLTDGTTYVFVFGADPGVYSNAVAVTTDSSLTANCSPKPCG